VQGQREVESENTGSREMWLDENTIGEISQTTSQKEAGVKTTKDDDEE
jgi:hypothetical protein